MAHKVSITHPFHHVSSTQTPTPPYFTPGGVAESIQQPLSALGVQAQPETEPLHLVLGFWPQTRLPAHICKHDACDHHHFNTPPPPLPPYTTHHHCLTQQTWNQAIVAWLWVFGINTLPPLTFVNANVCDHRHIK